MTNEEISNRVNALAAGDSNDAEIEGLREIIAELQNGRGTEKFSLSPYGHKMHPADKVFVLTWEDVQNAAADSFDGDGVGGEFACSINPKTLSSEEMHSFRKCLEAGLGSWSEVVQIALMAATVGRMDAPGAIGRANRFAATGDTDVLLEGLPEQTHDEHDACPKHEVAYRICGCS